MADLPVTGPRSRKDRFLGIANLILVTAMCVFAAYIIHRDGLVIWREPMSHYLVIGLAVTAAINTPAIIAFFTRRRS